MRRVHGKRRLTVVNIRVALVVERVGGLGGAGGLGECQAGTLQRAVRTYCFAVERDDLTLASALLGDDADS